MRWDQYSRVDSFEAYIDSLPVFVPMDENGRLEADERLWITIAPEMIPEEWKRPLI